MGFLADIWQLNDFLWDQDGGQPAISDNFKYVYWNENTSILTQVLLNVFQ